MSKPIPSAVIRATIEAAGGFEVVARKIGIKRSSVHRWTVVGVPDDRAPELADLARKAGHDITCEHLCPTFPWRHACRQISSYTRRHNGEDGASSVKQEA